MKLAALSTISIDVSLYTTEELEKLLHRTREAIGGDTLAPASPCIVFRGTGWLPMATVERFATLGERRLLLEE